MNCGNINVPFTNTFILFQKNDAHNTDFHFTEYNCYLSLSSQNFLNLNFCKKKKYLEKQKKNLHFKNYYYNIFNKNLKKKHYFKICTNSEFLFFLINFLDNIKINEKKKKKII